MENYDRVEVNGIGRCYYLNGKRHRLGAPAVITADGSKQWFQNGELYRENGPALELSNGTKFWFKGEKLHRIDGPAKEYIDGSGDWYYEGKFIDCNSQKEFERIIKPKLISVK